VTITAGDDYSSGSGREIALAVEDYAGPSLATATVQFRALNQEAYEADNDADAEVDVTVAMTIAGATLSFLVPLTGAQTAALATWPPADHQRNYAYQLVAILGTAEYRIGYGRMTVRRGITAAPAA
jgi:hypothetical protein